MELITILNHYCDHRGFAYRTFRVLELALYHSLGHLPEPELTHEIF